MYIVPAANAAECRVWCNDRDAAKNGRRDGSAR
jgi:hypothetical protein